MKRRNFLAMIPFVTAVCCKPKSKAPPTMPFVPKDPVAPDPPEETLGTLFNDSTTEKLFKEYFPTEEERLDKQIKYYKDMRKRLKT